MIDDNRHHDVFRKAARRSLWTRPWLMACAVIVALVYGSLLPFDFDLDAAVVQSGSVLGAVIDTATSPRWVTHQSGVSQLGVPYVFSDILLNLLLYVPLGFLLRLSLWSRGWRRASELAVAVVVGLSLSWTLESLQSLMPMRVAALNDVVFNGLGTLAGALIAVSVWQSIKRLSFAIYCRSAGWGLRVRQQLRRPGIVMLVAAVNVVLITVWYLNEVKRASDPASSWLPFESVFVLPYDLGALLLGEAMLVYAGIGCLLLLLAYTGARRVAMNWIVLAVVGLAFVAELTRALTNNAMPDITGVLLALAAASILTVTVYSFSHAVRRMERRQADRPFEGPDRRRQPHNYVE